MGGDLKDAVHRGIADGPAGPEVLFTLDFDDECSASMAVAENPVGPGEAADLGHEVGREAGILLGEVGPVPRDGDTCQFPVSRRGVLASRHLGCGAP